MEKPPKPKAPPPVKPVRETDDDASGMRPVPSKRKLPTRPSMPPPPTALKPTMFVETNEKLRQQMPPPTSPAPSKENNYNRDVLLTKLKGKGGKKLREKEVATIAPPSVQKLTRLSNSTKPFTVDEAKGAKSESLLRGDTYSRLKPPPPSGSPPPVAVQDKLKSLENKVIGRSSAASDAPKSPSIRRPAPKGPPPAQVIAKAKQEERQFSADLEPPPPASTKKAKRPEDVLLQQNKAPAKVVIPRPPKEKPPLDLPALEQPTPTPPAEAPPPGIFVKKDKDLQLTLKVEKTATAKKASEGSHSMADDIVKKSVPEKDELQSNTVDQEPIHKEVPSPTNEAVVSQIEPSADKDQRRLKYLEYLKGRLTINLMEIKDIRRLDALSEVKKSKVDAYVVAKLGDGKASMTKKTRVFSNQTRHIILEEEPMAFLIQDPHPLLLNGDLILHLEVWRSNYFADSLLSEVGVSLLDMFNHKQFKETGVYVLSAESGKKKRKTRVENGRLTLTLHFQPVRFGYLSITCREGRRMKSMDFMGKNDPYCVVNFGNYSAKTSIVKNGGSACRFNDEKLEVFVGSSNFTEELVFSVYDSDIGTDDLIGTTTLDLFSFCSESKDLLGLLMEGQPGVTEEYREIYQKKRPSGEMLLRIEYFPAGMLTVVVKRALHLESKDYLSKQDPFVQLTTNGSLVNYQKKTKTMKKGGKNVAFDETLTFKVVDHSEVTLRVYDEDYLTANDLIGHCKFSLLPIYKLGAISTTVKIKRKDKWGKIVVTGEVQLDLKFDGPRGVFFPQKLLTSDSFDHTLRKNLQHFAADFQSREEVAQESATLEPLSEDEALRKPAFSDAEISHCFKFFDLDQNGYLGFQELKHCLMCMGELITDEEVTEMITMLDLDGDGQVSFQEFYTLMVHPDPKHTDFTKEPATQLSPDKGSDRVANILPEAKRKKQAALESERAAKKQRTELMATLCEENEITFERINHFSRLLLASKHSFADQGAYRADFRKFCELFQFEALGKYKVLFDLLDHENQGKVSLKGFLMSLLGFVEAERPEKIDFAFELFDDDKNGSLDDTELRLILQSTHLVASDALIQGKLAKITRVLPKEKKIDKQVFHEVVRKFPNIIFPELHRSR